MLSMGSEEEEACSSRRWRSISDFMRFRITVQNILPGSDSRVIPLQLLQSIAKTSYFGNGMMISCLHSLGTFSSRQMVLNNCASSSANVFFPRFKSSAEMPSRPGDLLFFCELMAYLITSWVVMSCTDMFTQAMFDT